jgi:aerobic-type carbon monoxide dehydrogenase small subunit (CoxS/CutS family)
MDSSAVIAHRARFAPRSEWFERFGGVCLPCQFRFNFREDFLSHDELRERMSGNLCRCGAYNGIVDAITEVYAEEAE